LTGRYRAGGDDGDVRRAVSYGVAWAAAAVVATAVAWQGVALVGDEVTASRPAPLGTSEIASAPTTSTAAAPGSTTTTTTAPSPPATDPTGATPPPTPPPSAGPVGASPTTPAPAPSETRSYALVGGDASLRFSPSGVTVLFATPRAGFTVEVSGSHGNGVRVRFDGDEHRSDVEGWWDGGPAEEVREDSNG
jgi:hypothetical protein